MIGASSAGEFTGDHVERGSVAVGLLSSDDIKIFTALAEGIKEDPESTIKEAIAKLPDHVEGYPYMSAIILADGMSGAGEEIALLASYLFDQNIRIVGGMAADDFKMEQTCVFCDSNIRSNALTICLFASKMPLFSGVKHGHTPLSRALKATRVKGNVLYEINNRPAWEVWKEETKVHAKNLGIDVDQIKKKSEIISFFLNYLMGLSSEIEGEYKIRWPAQLNEDGSLEFTCGIAQGSIFRIMDGSNLQNQINSAEEAAWIARQSAENAGYSDFAGILVFDCAARQAMLQDRFCDAVEGFKKALPNIPLLGWETYGEIRLEPGQFSGFHNTTSVVLLIPHNNKPV